MGTHSSSKQDIFIAAAELSSPSERARFLAQACGDDLALRAEIEELLAHDMAEDRLLDRTSLGLAAVLDRHGETPGTVIGPYTLRQQIGEGGFGRVYLAEQNEPVRRKVALKIIKPGMDSRQVVARFEAERQALAMMDHPNIAKVHDAGSTENGRPYFVMELVQGVPITEYCDQCQLPTSERLKLIMTLCRAVQHAHQKGVIHRDLKPTNVLVTMQAGNPEPKVIDFGVAKAINHRLTPHTVTTAFHDMIGTPMYMSPEQAELSPLGVDTRTDIYSLGVVLYELLTGTTPFDRHRLETASYDELRTIIREEEPLRPSVRIATLTDQLAATVAKQRRCEPKRLQQFVRGDLDWIVMKCLEKDRTRRYDTAAALACDIMRHLRSEPVEARRPSPGYRLAKFIHRNRLSLTVACIVAAALIAGTAISTWQAWQANLARQVASEHLLAARQAERERINSLAEAYLSEARAVRRAIHMGHRANSLARIEQARDLLKSLGDLERHELVLRNEAIAALAVPVDLRLVWHKTFDTQRWYAAFDADLQRYARAAGADGEVIVGAVGNDADTDCCSLPGFGVPAGNLRFSPDGLRLGVVYDNSEYRVWNLRDARTELATKVYLGSDDTTAFSPTEPIVACVDPARDVRVMEIGGGPIGPPLPLESDALELQFDPSGNILSVITGDDVELWKWKSCERIGVLAHGVFVRDTDFSPDGRQLASVCDDFQVHLWNLESARMEEVFGQAESTVCFNHRGNLIATRNPTGHTILSSHPGWKVCVAAPGRFTRFSSNDQRLAFNTSSEIGVWEITTTGVYTQLVHARRQHPECAAFSGDSRVTATCHRKGVSFWETHSGHWLADVDCGEVTDVVFVPEWNAFVTIGEAGLLQWLVRAEQSDVQIGPPQKLSHQPVWTAAGVRKTRLASGGGRLAAAVSLDTVALIDLNSPDEVSYLKGHYDVCYIGLSADGQWAVTGTWHGRNLWLWNLRTQTHSILWSDEGHMAAAFSPDGKWLVASHGKSYRFYETTAFRLGYELKRDGDHDLPGPIVFTSDPDIVCLRTTASAMVLWDIAGQCEVARLEAPETVRTTDASTNRQGNLIADVSAAGVAGIWNLARLREFLAGMDVDWSSRPQQAGPEITPVKLTIVTDK